MHPDVQTRFYGCGTPFPPLLTGMTVLDLGCGAGRDCFILSKLVGEQGKVIGIDATREQIDFANNYREFHRDKCHYPQSNVQFIHGTIESLQSTGIAENSVDIIVSNCVINLSAAKADVLAGMFKLLKPGGEIYFADIYADRRLPEQLKEDTQIVGECIGDVLYYEDFFRLARQAGFNDVRVAASSLKSIDNKAIEEKLAGARLYSMTFRLFKLALEDKCEDYGQVAIYNGTLPGSPHKYVFDLEHTFETGKALPVCRNTALMLSKTRYTAHFTLVGQGEKHYGPFNCGNDIALNLAGASVASAPGGCGC
ncbi:methyltransferase domain-containing protein [Serratia rubidaea]|uniref:methyltransferase domain-containing protein n=1 Tax=Serratia rubidaea TaxID=61652 RepID=UPI002DB775C1|nr:methyltransferase domain-containing protein [Serratia rubidaea]